MHWAGRTGVTNEAKNSICRSSRFYETLCIVSAWFLLVVGFQKYPRLPMAQYATSLVATERRIKSGCFEMSDLTCC